MPANKASPFTLLPVTIMTDLSKMLDLAFSGTGTHGMTTMASSPELDGNIATIAPKRSSNTSIIDDKELMPLDGDVCDPEEAYIRGP